jgi:hypothetical protein
LKLWLLPGEKEPRRKFGNIEYQRLLIFGHIGINDNPPKGGNLFTRSGDLEENLMNFLP